MTTIWYKNINLPFFKRSKYVKYVKNPIGFAHKNLTTVFFTPKQEIRAFRHYFFSLLLTEKWFLCDMERVALFFLSRFGDNSVTIDGDLKQKLVRFDKIFFSIFLLTYNTISESGDVWKYFFVYLLLVFSSKTIWLVKKFVKIHDYTHHITACPPGFKKLSTPLSHQPLLFSTSICLDNISGVWKFAYFS